MKIEEMQVGDIIKVRGARDGHGIRQFLGFEETADGPIAVCHQIEARYKFIPLKSADSAKKGHRHLVITPSSVTMWKILGVTRHMLNKLVGKVDVRRVGDDFLVKEIFRFDGMD